MYANTGVTNVPAEAMDGRRVKEFEIAVYDCMDTVYD